MYIIIAGGGDAGYYLAKALLEEGHEVLVIEKSHSRCRIIEEEMGKICLVGDASNVATLKEGGVERADMLIALTNSDADNLAICQIAKHQFNVRKTIARLKNPAYEKLFKNLGVDITICSTKIILEHIEKEIPTHFLTHLMVDEKLYLVEIKLPPYSEAIGKKLKDIPLPAGAVPCLLIRGDYPPFTVGPETTIQAGDRLIIALPPKAEEEVKQILCGGGARAS